MADKVDTRWSRFVRARMDHFGEGASEFGRRIGRNRSLILQWLNDGKLPRLETLPTLLAPMEVSLHTLLRSLDLFPEHEFDDTSAVELDPDTLTDDQLVDALRRRLGRRRDDGGLTDYEQAPRHVSGPEIDTGRTRPRVVRGDDPAPGESGARENGSSVPTGD